MDRSTNTYTATWVFAEFEANQIELTLSENVTDLMGHMLDGDGYVTADDVTDYDYIILSGYYAKVWIMWGYDFVLGDTDGDGDVDGADVDEFIALVCASQYTILGDMNEDGAVDGLDVEYFADMLLYHALQF